MLSIAPEDAVEIGRYVADIKGIGKFDLLGGMTIGGARAMLSHPILLFRSVRHMGISLEKWSGRFKNQLLKDSFRICEYSIPVIPYGLHLGKKADGANGGIKWPPGGIANVVQSMAVGLQALGGSSILEKR